MDQKFITYITDQGEALDRRVAQWTHALANNPYATLERIGNVNAMVDVVAERAVFRMMIQGGAPENYTQALEALERCTRLIQVNEGGARAPAMHEALMKWTVKWAGRLKRLRGKP